MISELLPTYYSPDNIILSNQNNYTLPVINDFIIINDKDLAQAAYPLNGFDVINQMKTITPFDDREYQIDLYGNNADIAARILYSYTNSSAASNYLLQYNLAIGKVKKPINMTRVNDRDRFMKRYVFIFTALSAEEIKIPAQGLSLNDIEITSEEFT